LFRKEDDWESDDDLLLREKDLFEPVIGTGEADLKENDSEVLSGGEIGTVSVVEDWDDKKRRERILLRKFSNDGLS
jgi:hypothetical protein